MRRLRISLAVPLVAALALPLTACTGGPQRPPVEGALGVLVAGLRSGDLSAVPLTTETSADPQAQLTEVLEPLVEATGDQEVTVASEDGGELVEGENGTATHTSELEWSWQLTPEHRWTYRTSVVATFTPPADGEEGPVQWSFGWSPDVLVPDLQDGERVDVDLLAPDRGDILDGAGAPLVTERDVWRIGIDKTRVAPDVLEPAARELAKVVGLDPDAYADQVASAGDKAFVDAITIRQTRPGTDFSVEEVRALLGVTTLPGTLELAPTSEFARPILGRAGEATAEIVEESAGRVRPGDVTGLSGLQRQYDAQLAGSGGVAVNVVSAESAEEGEPGEDEHLRELFRVDPVDGTPLETTLDVALQEHAEKVLEDVGPASAIVAVRPSSGEVLAAASGPGGEGLSTATLGQYAPGSTFKVVDALAMIRSGLTPKSTVTCTPTLTVDGREYQNVPNYPPSALGDVPFRTAFAHSCNTAMISQRDTVDQAALATAAADLGLLGDAAVGAPVFLGKVPSEASGTAHAEAMIGQGEVLASPLGMATVAASVAAGQRVEPVLVRPAEGFTAEDDGQSASSAPSAAATPSGPGLTPDEAATIRSLMSAVVTEGSASGLRDVPGIVGAKTGTAQYGDGSRQHVWMLAIVDDLAVAVFVEDGDRGSTTAGPLMGAFLAGR